MLHQDKVRIIKISKQAIFEYLYEKFIDDQEDFLDVEITDVSNFFDIDFENGRFIFCAIKAEDDSGKFLSMPDEVNLRTLMEKLPDTTDSMFSPNRYKDFSKEELIDLSKS